MMGILDYLTGATADPANSNLANPAMWGALNQPSPVNDPNAQKLALDAFLRSIMQNPTEGVGGAANSPIVNPGPDAPAFPAPLPATAQPQAPQPGGFGAGAAPFSFAGPGSMNVQPSQMAAPPSAAAPSAFASGASPVPFPNAGGLPSPQSAMAQAPAPAAADEENDPIAVGNNYQMPRIGSGFPDDEETPAAATPTSGTVPAAATAPAPFSFGGNMAAAQKSFQGTSGLIPGVANAIQGLVTGQPVYDKQTQVKNATAQALLGKGVPAADVQAAANNPELMKALIDQYYGKEKYSLVKTADGMGVERPVGAFNQTDGTIKKFEGADTPSANGGGGLGDMSKTGAEYLATVPKAQAGIIKGMIDGTIQPPSSFAMSKPYWQAMLAAAKNADPAFDETKWGARSTMGKQLALSSNSSMGGILSNGESSFKHLAEYTKSAADLGNTSINAPFGGVLAHGVNAVTNTMGNSDTFAKLKAINDNLGHYGQESTKFYAGTGGGVEERMNALKEMNPTTTSSAEMAAYAEKEKSLMLDRLNTKFDEIRNIYGEEQGNKIIAQHMPAIQENIATIDANIAKLRGGAPTAATVAPLAPGASTTINGVTIKRIN